MKRTMTTALCVAAAACWVAVASAQSTTSSPGSQSGYSQSQPSKSGETFTLTGCVEANPSGKGFVLTNVTESGTSSSASSSSGSSSTGSMSGQSGAMGTSGTANSVELVPNKKVDLKEHVGHKVEITGTSAGRQTKGSMGEESGGQAGTSGTQSGSMSGSTTGKNWQGKKIKVDSLRMISESCSGQ